MAAQRSLLVRVLRALASWLGVLLLTLGLGEAGARLLGVRPLTDASLLWRPHPLYGWHHEPGSRDLFVKLAFTQPIEINSKGLREREIPYEKAPGTFRVLVIGDSSVASFEVPPEATYPRLVEEALRARGVDVEIVNAGVRGWGTDQALLFLEEEGLRYAPDLVLYKWTVNDREDNATIHRPFRRYGKPWFDVDASGELALHGTPVPEYPYAANLRVGDDGEPVELAVPFRSRLTLWLRDVAICRSAFATALLRAAVSSPAAARSVSTAGAYDDTRDVAPELDREARLYRTTLAMIRRMQRSAEDAGARFVMIGTWPGARDDWGASLRADAGLPDLQDMERYKARVTDPDAVLVPLDPHWNELGHRLYAEALEEALVGAGLVGAPAVAGAP